MDLLGFVVLNGFLYGTLLFMLAAGLTLIYGLMGVINFAHASFYMIGAYLAFQVSVWWNFWAALIVVPLMMAALGGFMRRFLIAPLAIENHLGQLLLTFGVAVAVTELVQIIWGRLAVNYPIPASMTHPLFKIGGLEFSTYRFFVLAVSVVLFVVIAIVVKRTRIGLLLSAAQTRPQMVRSLGYDLDRLFDGVFAAGAAVAGVAGVLGGNLLGVYPVMADQVSALLFVIVCVGGLGSLTGAFIVAVMVGLLETLATTYKVSLRPLVESIVGIPAPNTLLDDFARISSTSFAPMMPYLLMVVLLLLRPRGLFGTRDL